jgi:hypothetical protein
MHRVTTLLRGGTMMLQSIVAFMQGIVPLSDLKS